MAGGLQNTVTNLVPRWAPLVGAVLIISLTTGLVNGVQDGSAILATVTNQAKRKLEADVSFTSRQRPQASSYDFDALHPVGHL